MDELYCHLCKSFLIGEYFVMDLRKESTVKPKRGPYEIPLPLRTVDRAKLCADCAGQLIAGKTAGVLAGIS